MAIQTGTNPAADAQTVLDHIDTLPDNPYRGLITIKKSILGPRHALVRAWNKQVDAQPELSMPKL